MLTAQQYMNQYVEKVLKDKVPVDKDKRSNVVLRQILLDCFTAGLETGIKVSNNEEIQEESGEQN